MKIIRVKNYEEMSVKLNEIFVETLKIKPDCVLSFTTGATPARMVDLFAQEINNGLDISSCHCLNLDEYVGSKDGVYSVNDWMHTHFYNKLKVKPKSINMFDANARNFDNELKRYEEILRKYPRDVQMVGLGTNGHIGACEPGTPFDTPMFVADLYESTIESTRRLFNLTIEETPTKMFTMGFNEVMEAKCVVLAASGKSKAEAVKKTLEGEINENAPASYLRNHDNFIFIIDDEAASLLEEK